MPEIKIAAEARTEFGKGAARRIRRAEKVPAVLYEHGNEPLHVTLPGHALMMALKEANALLGVELDGESHLAIPKQIQRDPLRGFIEHADLLLVKRGEKVIVDVPLTVTGIAESGALVMLDENVISLEAEATHLPSEIEISVDGLDVGAQIFAKDLNLPKGSSLAVEEDLLIVNVTAAPTAADLEADTADETEEADAPDAAVGDSATEAESE